jgi:Kef-type K+ transport system membrane component KefB
MVDTTTFMVGLFLLFAAAVLVGELFTRFGQAALVGQLAVGVILGPTLLGPALGISGSNPEIQGIQFLATFFVLVMAGLEVSPEQIYRTGASAAILGVSVFMGPFLLGAVVVPLVDPHVPFMTALFISLTLSITALPVMGIMLIEFRIGKTPIGHLLLNTAVINELCAVTVFAALLRIQEGGFTFLNVMIAVLSTALFLATVLAVHMLLRILRQSDGQLWKRLKRRFQTSWRSREVGFAILMVMALGAALYSQFLGLTFLVGAFYAGLLVTPESAGLKEHRSISQVFDAMTWGFFIPLFFAFVGLSMNLTIIGSSWPIAVAFIVLAFFAVFSKILVGWLVARVLGWPQNDAMSIGFFVCSRGAVELAMALILLSAGIFNTEIFTIVAAVGLVTTIISPIGAARYRQAGLGTRLSAWKSGTASGLPSGPDETPIL